MSLGAGEAVAVVPMGGGMPTTVMVADYYSFVQDVVISIGTTPWLQVRMMRMRIRIRRRRRKMMMLMLLLMMMMIMVIRMMMMMMTIVSDDSGEEGEEAGPQMQPATQAPSCWSC
jgi:hypothetical protein